MDNLALDLMEGIRDIFSPIFIWIKKYQQWKKKSQQWISSLNILNLLCVCNQSQIDCTRRDFLKIHYLWGELVWTCKKKNFNVYIIYVCSLNWGHIFKNNHIKENMGESCISASFRHLRITIYILLIFKFFSLTF